MVEQFTGFRTSNGKAFNNARDAWVEELTAWFMSHGCDNMPIARKIVEAINTPDGMNALQVIIGGLNKQIPPPPTLPDTAPPPCAPGSMESTFCVHNVALTHICPQCPPVGERMSLPGLRG